MVACVSSYSSTFTKLSKKRESRSNLDSTDEVSPTHILSLAIRKRRELFDQKREPDLCRELLNKVLIQQLCHQLGQDRTKKARRHRKSRSVSKRRRSQDSENLEAKRPCIEDEDRLVIDECDNKGEGYINQFEYYSDSNPTSSVPSMVQAAPDTLDYTQMEKSLDSNEKEFQYNGYVAHWTASDSSLNSIPATNTNEQTEDYSVPSLSQSDPSGSSDSSDSNDSTDFNVPDDPLEMNALFRKLYRQSYSIIAPSREESLSGEEEKRIRFYKVLPLWRFQTCVC